MRSSRRSEICAVLSVLAISLKSAADFFLKAPAPRVARQSPLTICETRLATTYFLSRAVHGMEESDPAFREKAPSEFTPRPGSDGQKVMLNP